MKNLTASDIDEGKAIAALFEGLSDEDKNMALIYLSALRDRQLVSEKVG